MNFHASRQTRVSETAWNYIQDLKHSRQPGETNKGSGRQGYGADDSSSVTARDGAFDCMPIVI